MPTDWEDRYQAGDTPWDKGAAHPALLDFLREETLRGKILVPGSGLGYDVRAIANHENDVLGIDLAPSAIQRAQAFPQRAGERYELADLFALPERFQAKFDWVFEHTCFCAIDPARRADYVAAVANALKPQGKLLAIFYLDPGSDSGPPFGVSKNELSALFNTRFRLLKEWIPAHTYEGREGRELMQILQKRSSGVLE